MAGMRHLYFRSNGLRRLLPFGRRNNKVDEDSLGETTTVSSPVCEQPQKPSWKCFSFEEIHQATNAFHPDNLVGRGGYAEVYKGVLQNGQVIAVKRLNRAATDEQKEKEFLTELGIVGHVHHPNITRLLGCCIDFDLHLIFEFSSRGSVSSLLHDADSPPVAWKLRYMIALGTARGLYYLHKECHRRIIHRDIKASNILLTDDFVPQISDFGLAKWLTSHWTQRAVGPIEGTFGCLAPEYFMHGIIDEKTDVFAFGVFLLELISGRKPVDGSHKSLLSWTKPYLCDGSIEKMVDPRLGDDFDAEQLKRVAFTASLCIRRNAAWRPSMDEVMDLMVDGEISPEKWKMPEEDDEDEIWGFDDLEDCVSPSSSPSSSLGSH